MRLGNFEIPEVRLIPTTVDTLREISSVKKRSKIASKELAIFLGFKYGTEPHYYRKLHALLGFGLMEGKGIFQISDLGEKVIHPRSDEEKKSALAKAVLNVDLWREIYTVHGKTPREDNFWAVLMDIAKIDPDTAKSNATKILGWYEADVSHIPDDYIINSEPITATEDLRSTPTQDIQMSQQVIHKETPVSSMGRLTVPNMGTIEINDEDTLTIARSYLDVLEKKVRQRKTEPEKSTQNIIEEEQKKFADRMQ